MVLIMCHQRLITSHETLPSNYLLTSYDQVHFSLREEYDSDEEEEEGKPLTQEELRARALKGVGHST